MNRAKMRSVEWEDFPPELWGEIAEKLSQNEIDQLDLLYLAILYSSSPQISTSLCTYSSWFFLPWKTKEAKFCRENYLPCPDSGGFMELAVLNEASSSRLVSHYQATNFALRVFLPLKLKWKTEQNHVVAYWICGIFELLNCLRCFIRLEKKPE